MLAAKLLVVGLAFLVFAFFPCHQESSLPVYGQVHMQYGEDIAGLSVHLSFSSSKAEVKTTNSAFSADVPVGVPLT